MAIKVLRLIYEEFNSLMECPEQVRILKDLATEAAKKAYAPFSEFQVGVAIELKDGSTYTASNQENKAYPSGLCAERSGLFYVNGLKPEVAVIRMVLVVFVDGKLVNQPSYPCGACRQVMVESEERGGQNIEVWMIGQERIHKTSSVETLLPLKFSF